jgi:hypothetical protein
LGADDGQVLHAARRLARWERGHLARGFFTAAASSTAGGDARVPRRFAIC